MKLLISFFVMIISLSSAKWLTDFEKAQEVAKQEQKLILLNFSGSDWCVPCIKMEKGIFESDAFKDYADDHLVLVNADFPRQKKNQLSDEQVKRNEALAERFNKEGKFPYTVLMDAKGKVLKQWDGLPKESPEAFVEKIKTIVNVRS